MQIGDEVFMPTSTIPIPIVVSICVLLGYIMLGAFLFRSWENWDLSTVWLLWSFKSVPIFDKYTRAHNVCTGTIVYEVKCLCS